MSALKKTTIRSRNVSSPPTVLGRVVREVAFELSPESQFLGQQHA